VPDAASEAVAEPATATAEPPATDEAATEPPATNDAAAAGAAEPSGPAYKLKVACAPKACNVTVDGEARGISPVELDLPSGLHSIVLDAGKARIGRKVSISEATPVTTVSWNTKRDKWEVQQESAN
jgi:hypothetical protein